jgi:hypothetical protein
MFKTLLTLMAFASLTIVTRSYAQSDLPPLADQADPTPTPVPTATPVPIPLPTAAPLPGKWLTNEDEAINQATQQGKVILVDFDADWCTKLNCTTRCSHEIVSKSLPLQISFSSGWTTPCRNHAEVLWLLLC